MKRRLALVVLALFVLLVAVLLGRALFAVEEVKSFPAIERVALDEAALAQGLAEAIAIPTVSHANPDDDDVAVFEGDSDVSEAIFSARLTCPFHQRVRGRFETADMTAVAGEDYAHTIASVDLLPGDTEQQVSVPVYGDEIDGGVKINLRLSQEEWGDLVGATRESINKQMRAWTEAGIIRTDGGYIMLERPEALEQLAGCLID